MTNETGLTSSAAPALKISRSATLFAVRFAPDAFQAAKNVPPEKRLFAGGGGFLRRRGGSKTGLAAKIPLLPLRRSSPGRSPHPPSGNGGGSLKIPSSFPCLSRRGGKKGGALIRPNYSPRSCSRLRLRPPVTRWNGRETRKHRPI